MVWFSQMAFLCRIGDCPRTLFEEQAGLRTLRDLPVSASLLLVLKLCAPHTVRCYCSSIFHRDLLASASLVLGLKVCVTIPCKGFLLLYFCISHRDTSASASPMLGLMVCATTL